MRIVQDQSKQPAYILIVSGDQDPITARMRTEYAVGGENMHLRFFRCDPWFAAADFVGSLKLL